MQGKRRKISHKRIGGKEQITTFRVNKKIACCCKIAQCYRVYKTHVVSSQRDCLASPRQASRQMIRSRMRSSRYVSHLQTQTDHKIKLLLVNAFYLWEVKKKFSFWNVAFIFVVLPLFLPVIIPLLSIAGDGFLLKATNNIFSQQVSLPIYFKLHIQKYEFWEVNLPHNCLKLHLTPLV